MSWLSKHIWLSILVHSVIFCLYKAAVPYKWRKQGAKEVIFTACHLGKLRLAYTSPNVISQFFRNLNSSKNFTCPSGKLRTEFTSPIARSTSPGLADTTFFTCCESHATLTHINNRHVDAYLLHCLKHHQERRHQVVSQTQLDYCSFKPGFSVKIPNTCGLSKVPEPSF